MSSRPLGFLRAVRRRTAELRSSDERFRAIAEQVPGAVFSFESDESGVVDTEALDLGSCADRVLDVEFRARPDEPGVWRWLRIVGRRSRAEGGRIRTSGLLLDIDERKRVESDKASLAKQLVELRKMEAIGELAGGVAHDFNNLLTAIDGSVEQLAVEHALEGSARSAVHRISTAVSRCAELTANLLAFGRSHGGQRKPTSLHSSIRDIVSLLRRTIVPRIEIETRLAARKDTVLSAPGQLAQVVLNLCVNARDAMPEGGELCVSTANGTPTAGSAAGAEGLPVCLTVEDTGVGMDEATQARVFEPFFTTKEVGKGGGLGLSTVYGIVHDCDGSIRVSSRVGQGTSMQVRFPTTERVCTKACVHE